MKVDTLFAEKLLSSSLIPCALQQSRMESRRSIGKARDAVLGSDASAVTAATIAVKKRSHRIENFFIRKSAAVTNQN